jgi:phenylalanyl-tRNA synthetase beta subunit
LGLKMNYLKREGQGSVRLGSRKGKWATTLGRSGKGRRDGERITGWLWEVGPKKLREYRKEFLISRI